VWYKEVVRLGRRGTSISIGGWLAERPFNQGDTADGEPDPKRVSEEMASIVVIPGEQSIEAEESDAVISDESTDPGFRGGGA